MYNSTLSQDKVLSLHQKLDDVLHLWARKSGSGSFHFTVNNGLPNLQFVPDLGMENAVASRATHHQHHEHHKVKVKHRGPSRKLKNRERAVRHQAALAAAAVAPFEIAASAGRSCEHGASASPAKPILLPFTGIILPLRSAAGSVALATTSSLSPTSTPSNASSSATCTAAPVKTGQLSKNVDVSSIKKHLFVEKDKPSPLSFAMPVSPDKKFVKSEAKLWTKLFTTDQPSVKPPSTEPLLPKPPRIQKSPSETFRRKEQERFNKLFETWHTLAVLHLVNLAEAKREFR